MAGSLLLSIIALLSGVTGRNDNPPPPMPVNAIVGHALIGGRGADGVAVALDGRATTATTGRGAFRFDDVEAHTISISNYAADARFDRTSATASIDAERRAATVNFSGSYIRRSCMTGGSWHLGPRQLVAVPSPRPAFLHDTGLSDASGG